MSGAGPPQLPCFTEHFDWHGDLAGHKEQKENDESSYLNGAEVPVNSRSFSLE
jgi:hypothetical protein